MVRIPGMISTWSKAAITMRRKNTQWKHTQTLPCFAQVVKEDPPWTKKMKEIPKIKRKHFNYQAVLVLLNMHLQTYHWRELPQVSLYHETHLSSWQKYACCDKCFVTTKYFCCNKIFVATNICRDKNMFVVAKVLSRQAHFCCDKRRVLSQQTRLSQQKLVTTKI